jgi:hypothetical protein
MRGWPKKPGTQLAMGSTAAALWVSDDGAEQWQPVNAHLPPIHSVRFAYAERQTHHESRWCCPGACAAA